MKQHRCSACCTAVFVKQGRRTRFMHMSLEGERDPSHPIPTPRLDAPWKFPWASPCALSTQSSKSLHSSTPVKPNRCFEPRADVHNRRTHQSGESSRHMHHAGRSGRVRVKFCCGLVVAIRQSKEDQLSDRMPMGGGGGGYTFPGRAAIKH